MKTAVKPVRSTKRPAQREAIRKPPVKTRRRLFQVAPGRFMVRDCRNDPVAYDSVMRITCPCGSRKCLLFPRHLQCDKGCKTPLSEPVIAFLEEVDQQRKSDLRRKSTIASLSEPSRSSDRVTEFEF